MNSLPYRRNGSQIVKCARLTTNEKLHSKRISFDSQWLLISYFKIKA
uniref:Uncharacterized protein n=1 Tax=Rhizophora mucronata TaxID=61149 RepID=A0A2P2KY67_RHIMU